MDLGGFALGSPILYLKGMRIMMFQLSGFYCNEPLFLYRYLEYLHLEPQAPCE